MNVVLNLIWVLFGGIMIAIEYAISSILMMLTIVGIPFGLQTLKLAALALWPFGAEIRNESWPSGCLAGVMNIVWWFLCHCNSPNPPRMGPALLHHHRRHSVRAPALQTYETGAPPLRQERRLSDTLASRPIRS